jgi:hypothetical protein
MIVFQKYTFFFFLIAFAAKAQPFYFSYYPDVKVSQNNQNLSNPFVGGFNSAQFSRIKLDNDDIEDLVVFDRTSRKLMTFLAVKEGSTYRWFYQPKYEMIFPADITNWMLLVDYDKDGKKDIFTDTNAGFRVFRNTSSPIALRFELVKSLVYTIGFSGNINLRVPVTDIPAFVDLDEDGDIDVLTYDVQGTYVEYHKNLSRENYGHSDSLTFQKVNICWGKYQEGGNCQEFSFGVDCAPYNEGKIAAPAKIMHTGSTMSVLDIDGDGDKDAFVGDISCNYMFKMINVGTTKSTVFTQIQYFPNIQTTFPIFPASYIEDIDFDGKKDLLISPNTYSNEGKLIDFKHSVWLYRNNGSVQIPDFQYVQQDFLQNTMIELGENAAPAFADTDADGDLDMFVGNAGNKQNNVFTASFYFYENTGTKTKPEFTLRDTDYQLLSSQNFIETKPFFTDIDRNGTLDFCFTASINGGQTTQIKYLPNLASAGQPFQFNPSDIRSLPLTLSAGDVPLLYDVDNDGDLDAVVGKNGGGLQLYKMTGGSATAPVYTLDNEALFGITDQNGSYFPSVAVADFDKNNQPDLLYTDNYGILNIYSNFKQNLAATPTPEINILLDSLNSKYAATRLGGRLFSAIADLNNDGYPDLAVGMQGGGIQLFLNNPSGTTPPPDEVAELYPNPTTGSFYIYLAEDSKIQVFSILGQQIIERNTTAQRDYEINASNWASGLYLVRIKSASGTKVKKVVVNH